METEKRSDGAVVHEGSVTALRAELAELRRRLESETLAREDADRRFSESSTERAQLRAEIADLRLQLSLERGER